MKLKHAIIFNALFVMLLSSCGGVKNKEYEEFSAKMNQIFKDFIQNDNQQRSRKNIKREKRSFENKNEIIDMLNNSGDYIQTGIDIANAFEQSMYIPVIVGDGLVKYRKQSNFYNVITRYKDDGYVKVTNNGNETSTYIYIPSNLGFDNDTYYMYFDVTYNNENDYTFSGFQITDSGNTEWAFYGDSTLTFIEYYKTTESYEIRYHNAHLADRIYRNKTLIGGVREKIKNGFEIINKEDFRVLERDSQFVISEHEAQEIINRLWPGSNAGVETLGILEHNGVAEMYVAKDEERVVIPNNIKYLTEHFSIRIVGKTIVKELYIPKSVIGVKDKYGNITDVSNLSLVVDNNGKEFIYLEKIEIETGSTFFKTEGPFLTSYDGTALLYIMDQKVTELDLLKFNSFSKGCREAFCPKTILNAKTLKLNYYPIEDDRSGIFYYFVNSPYNYNYELLEVHNVTNDAILSFAGNNSIKHLVLEGDFESVTIEDGEEIVSKITLNSSNENAHFKGVLRGLKTIDIYNNAYGNNNVSLHCDNIEKIVVHEGVTRFDLNNIQFDYYSENKNVEVELPSTLEYFNYRSADKKAHIKISTKVNETIFSWVSLLKRDGYEVIIEDQSINKIFEDYESISYVGDKDNNFNNLGLFTYLGMESEIYVPSHILGKKVTSFELSAVTSLGKELPNLNVLKKVHLPNTLSCFSPEGRLSEKNYHLEELYFDGTLEQFGIICNRRLDYLLESGFCDKIICNDKTLSIEKEKDRYSYNGVELIINDDKINFPYVVVNKKEKDYILDVIINFEKYSIILDYITEGSYSGIINYGMHKLCFYFQANGELSLRYLDSSETGEEERVINFTKQD